MRTVVVLVTELNGSNTSSGVGSSDAILETVATIVVNYLLVINF